MKTRKARIKLNTIVGPRWVSAEIVAGGVFAVHRTYYVSPSDRRGCETFALTHLPTGLAIGLYYPSKAAAFRVARVIRDLADWRTVRGQADLPADVVATVKGYRYSEGSYL